jgi:hypothetical protein
MPASNLFALITFFFLTHLNPSSLLRPCTYLLSLRRLWNILVLGVRRNIARKQFYRILCWGPNNKRGVFHPLWDVVSKSSIIIALFVDFCSGASESLEGKCGEPITSPSSGRGEADGVLTEFATSMTNRTSILGPIKPRFSISLGRA